MSYLEAVVMPGFFVQYNSFTQIMGDRTHYFCGEQTIHGAICPNCSKPLIQFLTLDTEDTRLLLLKSKTRYLSLLFCWCCNVSQEPFYYRTHTDERVEILGFGQGGTASDFPYEDYPIFFPGIRCDFLEIPDNVQNLIQQANRGEHVSSEIQFEGILIAQLNHQVGGEPWLTQQNPEFRLKCCLCNKFMSFLASIGDESIDTRGFTGNPFVQVLFHFCEDCQVIGAFQQCD